ncbi:methionyl-tRNA formyltransferase [Flavobacterium sp. Fl-318]|uniref:Methionyl-tRNA formyltransferase n=1 Tax=Flavobacterium cupriresistens TaxID=2893885 RepID=A0ABU4RE42_9FLAO|nr:MULTISPECIES: methionyl-tRNA formyltransferase [unclassified Flavobacterium]MDX6190123.1 methionyl-tRNA formyltransferase [Flavobacterium sp. Fl-318]UFH42944.1 methionyl-tRNA formyltransferase [Flavobacterium sp. F-323]
MKIGLLASGGLGYSILQQVALSCELEFVMTDKSSISIQDFCKTNSLPYFAGNPRDGNSDEFLSKVSCDVLISINYLFLIEQNIIDVPSILAFNIHGSLLPKYRGRTPHVWSIINNEIVTGITAHLIDSGCDTGDIIAQVQIEINSKDTGASILEKYEASYFPLVESVLNKIDNNNLVTTPQNNFKATYFGKRTPEDGQINWSWQRERIYNWIRAQSFPYPGAFTYYMNQKITIDWVELDDYGFDYNLPDGTIITIDPIRIKTPNGLLKITKLRNAINNVIVNNKFENI